MQIRNWQSEKEAILNWQRSRSRTTKETDACACSQLTCNSSVMGTCRHKAKPFDRCTWTIVSLPRVHQINRSVFESWEKWGKKNKNSGKLFQYFSRCMNQPPHLVIVRCHADFRMNHFSLVYVSPIPYNLIASHSQPL